MKNGALFVFTNKRRRLLNVFYWDRTGCRLLRKRLEAGTFYRPRAAAVRKKSRLAELIENLPATTIVLTPTEVEAATVARRATGAAETTQVFD